MNNAELFKRIFGIYAEEFWAYPEEKMLDWIASDAPVTNVGDLISRQGAINAIENTDCELSADAWDELTDALMQLPSAQPWRKG